MHAVRWALGAFVRSILVLAFVALGVLQVRACSAPPRGDARLAEVRAQLAFLGTALRDDAAAERMQRVFPEGASFLAKLYGLSWAKVARAADTDADRAAAAREVAYALSLLESPAALAPCEDTQVARGVIWSGQRNLLLAETLDLDPAADRSLALVAEFHARSRELAQAFGLPWTSAGGARKSYLAGRLPMADAFVAFGLSIPLPEGAAEDDRTALGRVRARWSFHALATALQIALAAVVAYGVRRGLR